MFEALKAYASTVGLAIFVAGILPGCGNEAEFRGGKAQVSSEDQLPALRTPEGQGQARRGAKLLMWQWQCDRNQSAQAMTTSNDPENIQGGGEHAVALGDGQSMDIMIEGRMCEPEALDRDIVFVVDVSGSMVGLAGNDPVPLLGTSCGRRDAVISVLQSLRRNSRAQASIVTFSDIIPFASSTLTDPSVLMSDTSRDILCAGVGDTNYEIALREAKALLESGRDGASKEIYFISDGQPTQGRDGKQIADELKDENELNATIVTLMLRGDDWVLKNKIASKDAAGVPLHAKTDNAAALVEILGDLAVAKVVSGKLLYRGLGQEKWKELDVAPEIKGDTFKFPVTGINRKKYPDGIEFRYEFYDSHGGKISDEGRITWQ